MDLFPFILYEIDQGKYSEKPLSLRRRERLNPDRGWSQYIYANIISL